MKKEQTTNIDETLKKLEAVKEWFDRQSEPNIEEGLKKVEEASLLVSEGRKRLAEIENRFEEIKKTMEREKI